MPSLNRYGCPRELAWILTAGLLATLPATGWASPNDKQPRDPLDVHGGPEATEIHARCAERIAEADAEIPEYLEMLEAGRLRAGRMKRAGQLNVTLNQLLRDGETLQWMGEPSGLDFERRAADYKRQWDPLIRGYRGLPDAQKTIARIRLNAGQSARSRERVLEQLSRLVEQEKWPEAESRWLDFLDDQQATICFLSPDEQAALLAPFQNARSAIEQAMTRIRRRESAERLSGRMREAAPQYAACLEKTERVVRELGAGETAEWEGARYTAPQLLTRIFDQWKTLHVATLRCRAIGWALDDLLGKQGAQTRSLEAAHQDFMVRMSALIGQLLEAEAGRRKQAGDPAALARAHAESLRALADILARTDCRPLREAARRGLERFAEASFPLAEEIRAYERATGELLRWRGRVVEAEAGARSDEFPDLRAVFAPATRSTDQVDGLFARSASESREAHLVGTAPEAVRLAAVNLAGRPVTLDGVMALGETGIAQLAKRTYGSFSIGPLKEGLAAGRETMRSELLVDQQHEPLTLATAMALAVAERGDLRLVGGTVSGLHLEALVTRQATLPPAAWMLVPLGTLPDHFVRGGEPTATPVLAREQMQMRFELQPRWGHNGYALVELSP